MQKIFFVLLLSIIVTTPTAFAAQTDELGAQRITLKSDNTAYQEGDVITIDGGSGKVMLGTVPTVKPEISGYFSTIMKWADEFRKLKVRTNAETAKDTKIAREFGAEGIGLCRTEHMFFDEERILSVRQMILSKSIGDRNNALDKLLPHQKNDFKEIFKALMLIPNPHLQQY